LKVKEISRDEVRSEVAVLDDGCVGHTSEEIRYWRPPFSSRILMTYMIVRCKADTVSISILGLARTCCGCWLVPSKPQLHCMSHFTIMVIDNAQTSVRGNPRIQCHASLIVVGCRCGYNYVGSKALRSDGHTFLPPMFACA
jgi:hypothetical protein